MLYKPKFMSPDLNMDVKWAYYDEEDKEGNTKPIVFSCVCDGNSKIQSLILELVWEDIIDEKTYYFKKSFEKNDWNKYPIDYNGEYEPIEIKVFLEGEDAWNGNASYYGTDRKEDNWVLIKEDSSISSNAKDKKITAKYTLVSESGQKVYNYSTFYFKSKPILQIKTKEEYISNDSIVDTLTYSDQIFYGVFNSEILDLVPIQYYYWEIYDIDKNVIFKSEKIYSQDIQFKYSNFVNNNNYIVKCIIYTILGEEIFADRNFSVNYESSLLNFNYSYKIFPKETAIYFNWDQIRTLSGQLYELNGTNVSDTANTYKYYDNSGNLQKDTLSLFHLDQQHYMSLNNLHEENDQTLYWAGYIHPYYDTFFDALPIFSVEYLDENNFSHTLQLLKTNDQKIILKIDNQIPSDWQYNNTTNLNLTYRKGKTVWYVISVNIANKKLTFSSYKLASLIFPGNNWLTDENQQQYLNIGYGEWEGYNNDN